MFGVVDPQVQHNEHYGGDGQDAETRRTGLHKGLTVFDGPASTNSYGHWLESWGP